ALETPEGHRHGSVRHKLGDRLAGLGDDDVLSLGGTLDQPRQVRLRLVDVDGDGHGTRLSDQTKLSPSVVPPRARLGHSYPMAALFRARTGVADRAGRMLYLST